MNGLEKCFAFSTNKSIGVIRAALAARLHAGPAQIAAAFDVDAVAVLGTWGDDLGGYTLGI